MKVYPADKNLIHLNGFAANWENMKMSMSGNISSIYKKKCIKTSFLYLQMTKARLKASLSSESDVLIDEDDEVSLLYLSQSYLT